MRNTIKKEVNIAREEWFIGVHFPIISSVVSVWENAQLIEPPQMPICSGKSHHNWASRTLTLSTIFLNVKQLNEVKQNKIRTQNKIWNLRDNPEQITEPTHHYILQSLTLLFCFLFFFWSSRRKRRKQHNVYIFHHLFSVILCLFMLCLLCLRFNKNKGQKGRKKMKYSVGQFFCDRRIIRPKLLWAEKKQSDNQNAIKFSATEPQPGPVASKHFLITGFSFDISDCDL